MLPRVVTFVRIFRAEVTKTRAKPVPWIASTANGFALVLVGLLEVGEGKVKITMVVVGQAIVGI